MSVEERVKTLAGVPGIASMVFQWRGERLAETTLDTYLRQLGRMEAQLPDGLVHATKDQLAGYLAVGVTDHRRMVPAGLPAIGPPRRATGRERRVEEAEEPGDTATTVTAAEVEAALASFDPNVKATGDLP